MIETLQSLIAGVVLSIGGFFGIVPDVPTEPASEVFTYTDPISGVERAYSTEENTTLELGGFAPAAGGTYRTKTSVGTTDTSITLSSFKEPISEIAITMATLNTDIAYGTLDPQSSSRKEFISFTGITQNANGSATLTGVTRGLGFTDPFTASSTLRKAHPGQSIFILSDSPQFFGEYARRRADETITGYWTVPTPLADGNPVTKAYADSIANGGTVSNASVIIPGLAGETMATSTLVYFDTTDNEWKKTDANDTTTIYNVALGFTQGAGTDGNVITDGVLILGLDSAQSGLTGGDIMYASDTAGAISNSPGTNTRVIGTVKDTTNLDFNPFFDDSHSLLAGTNVFTGTNTFATSTTNVGAFNAWDGFFKQKLIVTDTGTSTIDIPEGISKIWVEGVGAGGTGGSCSAGPSNASGGGGGGAGGYFQGIFDVSGTSTPQVYVGNTAGQRTTFGTIGDEFANATGGTSGSETTPGVGGTATGGDINIDGQGGDYGETDTAQTSGASKFGGRGGSTPLGFGGFGAGSNNVAGGAATGYGSGGGGASCDNGSASGGANKQGILIFRW